PGNDDLGEMSSWYVWSALGLYPLLPGRAELVLGSPAFPRAEIRRADGTTIVIDAANAAPAAPYVHALEVDGRASSRAWLPADFVARGGTLRFELAPEPSHSWAVAPADRPPGLH
ncbi:MAG TPA: glycoside hydrolase domain-containing protein, partial [Dokdonella sp.]